MSLIFFLKKKNSCVDQRMPKRALEQSEHFADASDDDVLLAENTHRFVLFPIKHKDVHFY